MRTVSDPQELNALAELSIPDVDQVFRETEKILAKLGYLFDGTVGGIRYLGGEDYKGMLERIRYSMKIEKQEMEALRGRAYAEMSSGT